MGSGLKIFIPVDDGSIDALKAKLKEVRGEAKAANTAMQELKTTGQQVSREVMERVDKARAQLQLVSREVKDAKEVIKASREGIHVARETKEVVEKAQKVLTNRFAQAFMSGAPIGGKDLVREFISSDHLMKEIAKTLGAGKGIIQAIGAAGMVGTAALMGYEIGEKIRENLDKFQEERERLTGKKAGGEKLRELLEGPQWFGKGAEEALGLSGATARMEAAQNAEKFAKALEGLNADEISGAMTASRRKNHDRGIMDWIAGRNKQWDDRTQFEKNVLVQKDRRVGMEMAVALRQAEAKRREQIGKELTKEQLEEVFQGVVVDFMQRGEISGKEFNEIEKAHDKFKKIKNVNELYEERRKQEVFEATLAVYERRVPYSPMD